MKKATDINSQVRNSQKAVSHYSGEKFMVIPNIILLCDIIYNLEISQSAKMAMLLK